MLTSQECDQAQNSYVEGRGRTNLTWVYLRRKKTKLILRRLLKKL